jgi:hypothetical protein
MGSKVCKAVLFLFLALCLGALFVFLVGTFGWFGQERDPLSGVFLLPLGLPWNLLADRFPEAMLPWVAAGAPLLNVALLAGLCRFIRRT